MERMHQHVGTIALAFGLVACGLPPYKAQCRSVPYSEFSSDGTRALASSPFDGNDCFQLPSEETLTTPESDTNSSQLDRPAPQQVALLAPAAQEPEMPADPDASVLNEPAQASEDVSPEAQEPEPLLLPEDEASAADSPLSAESVAEPDVQPMVEAQKPVVEAVPALPVVAPVVEAAVPAKPVVKVPPGKPDPAAIVNPPPPKSSLPRLRNAASLHALASKRSATITTLGAGSPVQLMRSVRNAEGDWWYVKAVGESGWILAP